MNGEEIRAKMKQSIEAFQSADYPRVVTLCDGLLRELGPRGDLLNLKAAAHLSMGNPEAAEASIQKAVEADPERAGLRANAARINSELGRHEAATPHAQEALRLSPNDAPLLAEMAVVLREAGDDQAALEAAEKCLAQQPGHPGALLLKGLIHSEAGLRDAAERVLRELLDIEPSNALALALLVNLEGARPSDPSTVERLQQLCGEATPEAERSIALFSLASVFKRQEQFEKAFDFARRANAVAAKSRPFDMSYYESKARQIEQFADDSLAGRDRGEKAVGTLAFVIGLPRSGSTLLEQMLSAHPEALGCGELSTMESLESDLERQGLNPYAVRGPQAAGTELLERCRSKYLASLPANHERFRCVIDKAPGNYRRAGFIRRLFPAARFLYCQRHPLDLILSGYFQYFQRGHHYSYSLESLAEVYLNHRRIMSQWLRLMPERIHCVHYEALVRAPKAEIKAAAGFLGLDFDPLMTKPENNPRSVKTASRWQVRQPVYRTAVEQWRHYEMQLAPAIRILRDAGALDEKLRAVDYPGDRD